MRERPIIFVSGCFDVLHPGHIRFLKAAKEKGKTLVVGLNSDESVQKIKGHPPYLSQDARREVLLSIQYVDEVIIFDEEKPWKLVAEISPYVWYRGADHDHNVVGPAREEPFYSSVILEKLKSAQFEKVVPKVWGTEYWIVNRAPYCAKLLELKPGFASSLHFHDHKIETFVGVTGHWTLEYKTDMGMTYRMMSPGDSADIAATHAHRISSDSGATLLEISTQHDDLDVIRLQESRRLQEEPAAAGD